MRAKSFLGVGLLAVVMVVVSACGRRDAGGELPVLGAPPAWALKDLSGREVKSTDFAGKVVLVDFWATWCAPCLIEIPEYIAWQKKYADRGLVIVGLSVDDGEVAEVRQFVEKQKMNYPVVMADLELAERFPKFRGYLPTAYLIDRTGNVRYIKEGLGDMKAFEKLLESLL